MGKGLQRQRHILDFTLAALWRRKGRNLALLVVYTAVVFLLASVMFFTQAVKREAAQLLSGAPEMVVQKLLAGRHELIPAAYLEKIREIMGVAAVRGRLWGYYYDPAVGTNYTLLVPEVSEPEPGRIRIGQGVARARRLAVGDLLTLRGADGGQQLFEVKQLLPDESELLSADLILISAADFTSLFGQPPGYFTDLTLTVRNPNELATIAGKIVAALPDTRPISRAEMARTYEAVFDWRGGVLIFILATSLLAFAIFAWEKASGLSGEEKREIGILKAIGWETSDVLLLKFWEGLVVSLSAFLLGIILAYLHVFLTKAPLLAPALKGWSVLYPDFRLTPFIDPAQLFTLFFLAVVPYTVATIVPAWRAATVDPAAVMRS
ncbi:MAG: FtsX-like permease family protein [Desulfobulbaceae bacterium]|nr:FtsX-like permease family protein [Desulfobulbaceae bacterium]